MSNIEDNKQILRTFIDLFNCRAPDFAAVMSDDFVWRGIEGAVFEGRRAYEEGIKRVPSDMQITIDDIVAEGDRVLVRLRMVGTRVNKVLGRSTTDGPVFTNDLFRIQDGKIAEEWSGHR